MSPPSLRYMQMNSEAPPRPRTHHTSPLDSHTSGTLPPPLRLASDQRPLAHQPGLYLSPGGAGSHLTTGRPVHPFPADSQRLFFNAVHDRLSSPQPPSRPYFPCFSDLPPRASHASPQMLSSNKNLLTGLGGRKDQMDDIPPTKRVALEEGRLMYPFSLSTAQLKIASRSKLLSTVIIIHLHNCI